MFPILSKGRVRPYQGEDLHEVQALPLQWPEGTWGPLELLGKENVTRYQDMGKLKEAWQKRDKETLSKELWSAYGQIAGTPFQEAYGKKRTYPSYNQLRAEKVLMTTPFTEMLIGLYATAFLLLLIKKRDYWIATVAFCIHTLFLGLRSYVLERPPVSTMFESVLWVPWVIILFAFKPAYRLAATFAATLLLVLLFLSGMAAGLENVQAVLDSQYWLIAHVLLVASSYGLFILAGILGHIFLFKPKASLSKLILQSMYVGIALLIPGTLLGGIWAAESWGRFWDWDPKEAWAFISACVYLFWIHAFRFKMIGPFGLAIGSIVGLLFIAFTWYGVNYILGKGLHSYGFGNGGALYFSLFMAAEILFLLYCTLRKKRSSA